MENTKKMPITYEKLKQALVESGRPYDFDMIDRAYGTGGTGAQYPAPPQWQSPTSAIRSVLRRS